MSSGFALLLTHCPSLLKVGNSPKHPPPRPSQALLTCLLASPVLCSLHSGRQEKPRTLVTLGKALPTLKYRSSPLGKGRQSKERLQWAPQGVSWGRGSPQWEQRTGLGHSNTRGGPAGHKGWRGSPRPLPSCAPCGPRAPQSALVSVSASVYDMGRAC